MSLSRLLYRTSRWMERLLGPVAKTKVYHCPLLPGIMPPIHHHLSQNTPWNVLDPLRDLIETILTLSTPPIPQTGNQVSPGTGVARIATRMDTLSPRLPSRRQPVLRASKHTPSGGSGRPGRRPSLRRLSAMVYFLG